MNKFLAVQRDEYCRRDTNKRRKGREGNNSLPEVKSVGAASQRA